MSISWNLLLKHFILKFIAFWYIIAKHILAYPVTFFLTFVTGYCMFASEKILELSTDQNGGFLEISQKTVCQAF